MGMNEFKKSGGALGGRGEQSDAFAGEPRAVGSTLGNGGNHILGGAGAEGTTSMTDGNMANGAGHHHHNATGTTGATVATDTTPGTKKGGLTAKLNPKVDSDGDGKAGVMD